MSFDLPLCIMVVFLLFTLLVAVFSTTLSKTFREHAVGKKQFSIPTLVITLLASVHGGGMFKQGISILFSHSFFWVVWQIFVNSICFLIIGWLARHMHKFMYHCSMPESIGRVYGKYPRLIVALISVSYLLGITAAQISAISTAIGVCIPSNTYLLTIMATTIICVYAILGGICAVTFTDIWQFITFFTIIIGLAWFMCKNINQLSILFLF